MAFRARKVFGTFEKRAPDFCCTSNYCSKGGWQCIVPQINHYPVEMENHVHICSLRTKLSNTFFFKYKGDITCSYYYFFNSHYFHPTYQIYSLHLKIQTQEFVSFFSSSFQVFPPLN